MPFKNESNQIILDIVLENDTDEIDAGKCVFGNVAVTLTKRKTVRNLSIQIYGVANQSWTDASSHRHTDTQVLIDEVLYLVGGPSEGTY